MKDNSSYDSSLDSCPHCHSNDCHIHYVSKFDEYFIKCGKCGRTSVNRFDSAVSAWMYWNAIPRIKNQ